MADSFITFVQSDSEILPVIEERKSKYATHNINFQPLVVLTGDIQSVISSKVVVDNTIYTLPSPIEAVDACFKIVHATNACYQEECEALWLFIQLYMYEITTKYDRINQSIRNLAVNLGLTI